MFTCLNCRYHKSCIIYQKLNDVLLENPAYFNINKLYSIFEAVGLACDGFKVEKRKEDNK